MTGNQATYYYKAIDKQELKKLSSYYGFTLEETEDFYRLRDRRTNLISYTCVSPKQLQTYLNKLSWQG